MLIKGIQKLSLLDFPGKVACTVFTYGCNFRCPFCHNASLVLGERNDGTYISEEEFYGFLESRRGMLEGVCVSGGEPTLQPDLTETLRKIKAMGYAVKLDTNGYRPDVLRRVINEGLVDYVAMDIKNSPSRYGETVGIEGFDMEPIYESVAILREGNLPYEFRTTVVAGLHTDDEMLEIGGWLTGDEKFFLQSFRDSGDLISEGLVGYDKNDMDYLAKVLKCYIPSAETRG